MGSEKSYLTFFLVLTYGAYLLPQLFASCKEFRRVSSCFKDLLSLDCGKDSLIAVHEAYFTSHHENGSCHLRAPELEYIEDEDTATEPANDTICYQDIRLSVNRKCSGLQSCDYSYSQELDRLCANPEGLSIVHYDCVNASKLNKYCNSKVTEGEGYISSPSYPQLSPPLKDCSWTISASEGQTIFAKILHLHLRDATDVRPTISESDIYYGMNVLTPHASERMIRCEEDSLTLLEGILRKFSVCGEDLDALRSVELDAANHLELRFRSVDVLPGGGFLLYYKVKGCPNLPAKEDSVMLERNGSAATYACRNGHQVFNDTLDNKRYLQCIRDHHWNDTLSTCISLDDTIFTSATSNSSLEQAIENISINVTESFFPFQIDKDASLTLDIIIPTMFIAILIIGNTVVLIIICALRRQNRANVAADLEEFVNAKHSAGIEETPDETAPESSPIRESKQVTNTESV